MRQMRRRIGLAIGSLVLAGLATAALAQPNNARRGQQAQAERLTADGKYRIVQIGGRLVREPVQRLDGFLPGFRVPRQSLPSASPRGAVAPRTQRSRQIRHSRTGRKTARAKPARTVHRANVARVEPKPSIFGGARSSALVAEARRYLGTNPTGRARLWCARFVNFVLKKVGQPGTNSDAAKSFASYGRRISGPQVGAIAVLTRKGGGHVGIVTGVDRHGNPILIAGNNGRRKVGISVYPKRRVIAYVMPDGSAPGGNSRLASTSGR